MVSPDPTVSDERADDLFGRWLAHREQTDATATVTAATSETDPHPATSGADTVVAKVTSPTGFAKHTFDGERDAVWSPQPDFEPVLIASMRKKAEATQPEKLATPAKKTPVSETAPPVVETVPTEVVPSDSTTASSPESPTEARTRRPSRRERVSRLSSKPRPRVTVEKTPRPSLVPPRRHTRERSRRAGSTERHCHGPNLVEMPGVYTFAPVRSSRRVLTLALLAGVVASAYFARIAVMSKDTVSVGIAVIVIVGTAMLWAVWAGATVTKLTVSHGQLEVVRQGGRFVFDLASVYTPIEVHGRPGRHGWKVLFLRPGMAPFVVDRSVVDGHDFMRVLTFYRPETVEIQ